MNEKKVFALNYSDLHHPSHVSGSGSFAEFILPEDDSLSDLSLGSRVIIQDFRGEQQVWLSGTIIEILSLSPFISDRDIMLYNKFNDKSASSILSEIKGPHSENRLIAKIKIDIELEKDEQGNYLQITTQKPASNRSKMTSPSISDEYSDIPSMIDILGLKKDGVVVGYVGAGNKPREENNKFLPYFLDISNLDNRHIFIVGESGSGKTVLLKSLAYGLRTSTIDGDKPRIIMTDVQGDLLQLMMSNLIGTIPLSGWQSRINSETNVNSSLEKMGPFQLILPVSKRSDVKMLSQIQTIVEDNGHKVSEVGLRLQDISNSIEIEYLLRLSSEQAITVIDDEIEAMKDEQLDVTINQLEARINRILNNDGDEKQLATSKGTKFYKSTYLAALRGLRHLRDIFDFHQPSLSSHVNPLDCLNFEGTSIFFLEHLDPEERLMWGMQLVKWLYENKRKKGQFFVFIDEAHQLIPSKPPSAGKGGTYERLRDNFEKLSREGRKFGINLVLGTQSPRDLHEIVPQQCPTKIVMKIDKSNAYAAQIDDGEARIACRFGQGQMYLRSPFNGTSDWLRVHAPAPSLPHESMTNFWTKLEKKSIELLKDGMQNKSS